jgi:hypothetical protein
MKGQEFSNLSHDQAVRLEEWKLPKGGDASGLKGGGGEREREKEGSGITKRGKGRKG